MCVWAGNKSLILIKYGSGVDIGWIVIILYVGKGMIPAREHNPREAPMTTILIYGVHSAYEAKCYDWYTDKAKAQAVVDERNKEYPSLEYRIRTAKLNK